MGFTDFIGRFSSIDWKGKWILFKKILFDLFKIPFEFFRNLPEWVKILILIFLVLLSIIIIFWYFRHKKDWMYVKY